MQVSVEDLGGLKRRMTIQVPAQDIEPKVKDRLVSLSRRVKVNGFRPGKVPLKLTQNLYGAQVRGEIVEEVLQHSFQEALTQEKLKLAGSPKLELKTDKQGEDLEYSVTFEVMPEFELVGLDGLKVERPVAQVVDTDVDNMIENLRKQNTLWTDTQRPAQTGDKVTLDFEGKLNGEDFPGNKGDNMTLIIGSNMMLEGFETALVGLPPGAESEFDLTFPDDYHAAELAAKTARFKVKITTVAESSLPAVDDEFIAKFDAANLDELRKAVRENMERELREGIKSQVKHQLMDGLLSANNIPLPQAAIYAQIERMARQARLPQPKGDDEKIAVLKEALFGQEARRRAALGLLISKIVAVNGIKLEESRVRAYLESIASTYQEAEQVIEWYERSPESMEGIRSLALEDQVVDWLLERATVSDKPSSFDEVMKPMNTPDVPVQEATP